MSTKIKSKAIRTLEKITGKELDFAFLLKSLRECDGLTQEEFGKVLGVKKSYICDLEHSRTFVSPEQAARFAKALGYPEDYFVRLALEDYVKRNGLSYKIKLFKEAS